MNDNIVGLKYIKKFSIASLTLSIVTSIVLLFFTIFFTVIIPNDNINLNYNGRDLTLIIMMTTIAFICVLFISSISIHGILCHKIRKTNFLNNRVLLFSISLLSILPLIIVGDILNLIFINIEIKKSNFDDIENKDIKKILKKYSLFSLWPKIVIFVYTIIIIFSTVFSNLDIPNTPENLIVLISFYVFVVFYGVSIPGYFIISLVSGILLFKEIKLLDKSYENKSILLLLSILSIFSISLNLIIMLTFVIMKDNLFKKKWGIWIWNY